MRVLVYPDSMDYDDNERLLMFEGNTVATWDDAVGDFVLDGDNARRVEMTVTGAPGRMLWECPDTIFEVDLDAQTVTPYAVEKHEFVPIDHQLVLGFDHEDGA